MTEDNEDLPQLQCLSKMLHLCDRQYSQLSPTACRALAIELKLQLRSFKSFYKHNEFSDDLVSIQSIISELETPRPDAVEILFRLGGRLQSLFLRTFQLSIDQGLISPRAGNHRQSH